MIVVKNISKHFNGHTALQDISFEVKEGETMVLLGTSGSGKTTMLRLLNRLLDLSSGSIYINGSDISLSPPEALRRNTGYVLQGYGLFPHYTVAQNIAIVPSLLKWPRQQTTDRVIALLEKLQLPPAQYANAYPETLSGGQKQRVGLARALAANPPLLLMDEPFGALDPLTRNDIIKAFNQLDELKKKTIVLVTHSVDEAMQLGDKIILLDKGKIVQAGSPEAFLTNPANSFVKQFFSGQSILRSKTLTMVWEQLEDAGANESANLSSDQTLWEALEFLLTQETGAVVVDADLDSRKFIDLDKIRSLYQQTSR
jgi:osmoprotectant transport system ATP-binding protein